MESQINDAEYFRNARQRSFTSLMKSYNEGRTTITEENPTIVFDSAEDNTQIRLTHRNPSFASLSGTLTPKGYNDMETVIEVKPAGIKITTEEEEADINVRKNMDLELINAKRWKEIGYEPTEDVIPIVRAASQNMITVKEKMSRMGKFPVLHDDPEKKKLFGRLGEIVKDAPDSKVYASIADGKPDPAAQAQMYGYIEECERAGWREESDYLQKLIIPTTRVTWNGAIKHRIEPIPEEPEEPELKPKHTPEPIEESIEEPIKEELGEEENTEDEDTYTERDEKEYRRRVKMIDDEYARPSKLMQFIKPSQKLIKLKSKVKKLLRDKKFNEAAVYQRRVKVLETKEYEEAKKRYNESYYEAMRRLDEEFAAPKKPRRAVSARAPAPKKQEDTEDSYYLENKKLEVKAPDMIERNLDIKIIRELACMIVDGKDISHVRIDSITRQLCSQ